MGGFRSFKLFKHDVHQRSFQMSSLLCRLLDQAQASNCDVPLAKMILALRPLEFWHFLKEQYKWDKKS